MSFKFYQERSVWETSEQNSHISQPASLNSTLSVFLCCATTILTALQQEILWAFLFIGRQVLLVSSAPWPTETMYGGLFSEPDQVSIRKIASYRETGVGFQPTKADSCPYQAWTRDDAHSMISHRSGNCESILNEKRPLPCCHYWNANHFDKCFYFTRAHYLSYAPPDMTCSAPGMRNLCPVKTMSVTIRWSWINCWRYGFEHQMYTLYWCFLCHSPTHRICCFSGCCEKMRHLFPLAPGTGSYLSLWYW